MISTAGFLNCVKLLNLGVKLDTEFYYNRKTKERFPGNDIAKSIKDFYRFYVPAPAECELDKVLPASIKNAKGASFNLTVTRNKKTYKVFYASLDAYNYSEVYSSEASTQAEAKIILLIKLIKNGTVRI